VAAVRGFADRPEAFGIPEGIPRTATINKHLRCCC